MPGRFLSIKTKTLASSALLLAVSGLLSRFLGLFRDNLLANLFPKSQTDIYFAAFRAPDFLYGILIISGVSAAFLPVFAKRFKENPQEAKNLANSVLTFFLVALVLISLLLIVFAPNLVNLIAPGFNPQQKVLTTQLTRIMFLSPILLGISAIFSSILQCFSLFFAFALAPILYNLGIIFGILVFTPVFGLKGLAFGVILGAFLHLSIQLPPLFRAGFIPHFSFRSKVAGLKRVFILMAPRVLGAAAYQINLIVITAIASTLSSGSISVFSFSNNLQSVLIGLVGVSFATAVFPMLSKAFAAQDRKRFLKNFSSAFSQIIFLIIPLSSLLFLLRAQVVRLILGVSFLGRGHFGWAQTRLTAASLGLFSLSLFASCLVPFLARAFFSVHNTKTPVKIAVLSMSLNVAFSYFLVWLLGFPNFFRTGIINLLKLNGINNISVVALPLSFSLSMIIQFIALFLSFKKYLNNIRFAQICPSFKKIISSTLIMGGLTYGLLRALSLVFNTRTVPGIFLQTALAGLAGISAYLAFSLFLKTPETKKIFSLFSQKIGFLFISGKNRNHQ